MHYTWEQMNPVPRTHDESAAAQKADRKARFVDNKCHFDRIMSISGEEIHSKVHRIGYLDPEECTVPCAMEVVSFLECASK